MNTKPPKPGISGYLRTAVAVLGGVCIAMGIALAYQEKVMKITKLSISTGLVLLIMGVILIAIALRRYTNSSIKHTLASTWREAWTIIGTISVFVLFFAILGVVISLCLWIWKNVQAYETVSKWVADYQTLTAGIVGSLVMLLAVAVAWWELNCVRRTRYAGVLLRLSQVWDSDHYVESRFLIDKTIKSATPPQQDKVELCNKLEEYEKTHQKDYFVLIRTANFFEALAFLIQRKYVPLRDAREYFGQSILYYSDLFSTYIEKVQAKKGCETTYALLSDVASQLR